MSHLLDGLPGPRKSADYQAHTGLDKRLTRQLKTYSRGSIPAKVGFWVGLRMFSYVRTPTKLTNAISKTQLLGQKKGGFSPKNPRMWPFFVFGVF